MHSVESALAGADPRHRYGVCGRAGFIHAVSAAVQALVAEAILHQLDHERRSGTVSRRDPA